MYSMLLLCYPASPIEAAASNKPCKGGSDASLFFGKRLCSGSAVSPKYLQQWVVLEAAIVQIAIFIVCIQDSVPDCYLTLEAVV